jgi:hypothetical protein
MTIIHHERNIVTMQRDRTIFPCVERLPFSNQQHQSPGHTPPWTPPDEIPEPRSGLHAEMSLAMTI